MPEEERSPNKKLLDKIASGWGTIISFGAVLVIGGSAMIYMYNTFPTTNHIVGRFAQKSEINTIDDKYEQRMRDFEKKVVDDLKTFKRRYRKDKIRTLYCQLDVVKHDLYKNGNNPELEKYKTHLEEEIFDLLEKMDKED